MTPNPTSAGRPHGRSTVGRAGAILLALAGLTIAALTACSTRSLGTEAPAGAAATSTEAHDHDHGGAADDGVLDVVATDYAFSSEHATVGAGTTTIRLSNQGTEAHQVHVGRPLEPMTAEDFVDTYHEHGESAAFKAVSWVGGVSGVEPGATGSATVALEPGDYLLVCFFPTADGTSHVMEQMVAPLHVEPARTDPPGTVATDGDPAGETVVLAEYSITLPEGFRGQGDVTFRNDGAEPHEVVLVRVNDGRSVADVVAWQESMTGPKPFRFAGGVGTIAPGTTATATLDLAPGTYIATCFVPGPTGAPHIDLGMVALFTVT